MSHPGLLATASYLGLVLLVLTVAAIHAYSRTERLRRRSTNLLIAYVTGATMFAGATQINLWPFDSWSLMTGAPARRIGDSFRYMRLLAVGADGREYGIDYRAVEPFAIQELMAWMRNHFLTLSPPARDSAASY